mgnify:CR=1 FL=1
MTTLRDYPEYEDEWRDTAEMVAIALKVKPGSVCLVPEKRQELTTEGGLMHGAAAVGTPTFA